MTVSAATGALVAMLMRGSEFWTLVWNAVQLNHLLLTLLLVVASFTLIGPIEDFVFDIGLHPAGVEGDGASQPSRLERLFQRLTWRAYGRIGFVLILALIYPILLGCVEDRFHNVGAQDTAELIGACLVPGLVTYYWSAALQRGVPSITRSAGWAATTLMSVLSIPSGALSIGVFLFAGARHVTSDDTGGVLTMAVGAVMFVVICILAAPSIPITAALAAGAPAAIGGSILGRQRRRRLNQPILTICLISLDLVVLVTSIMLLNIAVISLLPHVSFSGSDISQLLSLSVAMFGWGAGLIVSGFPDIFRRAVTQLR